MIFFGGEFDSYQQMLFYNCIHHHFDSDEKATSLLHKPPCTQHIPKGVSDLVLNRLLVTAETSGYEKSSLIHF